MTAQRTITSLSLLSPCAFQQHPEEAEQSAVGPEGRWELRPFEPSAWARERSEDRVDRAPVPWPRSEGGKLHEQRRVLLGPSLPLRAGKSGARGHLWAAASSVLLSSVLPRLLGLQKGSRPRPGPRGGAVSSGRLCPERCGQRTNRQSPGYGFCCVLLVLSPLPGRPSQTAGLRPR